MTIRVVQLHPDGSDACPAPGQRPRRRSRLDDVYVRRSDQQVRERWL